jgi:hypothetical protein
VSSVEAPLAGVAAGVAGAGVADPVAPLPPAEIIPVVVPRPQDVHVAGPQSAAMASSPIPEVASAAPPATSARPLGASVGSQQWPAFYVVVAEPDLAVLSDPSRQGTELRRVKKVSFLA